MTSPGDTNSVNVTDVKTEVEKVTKCQTEISSKSKDSLVTTGSDTENEVPCATSKIKESGSNLTLIETKNSLARTFAEIKAHKLIAVDCEGVDLSRKGELTVLTVATENKTFIFDVLKLGQSVFDRGLRDILENKSVEKLMFDCRQDSDSLWHQFSVRLSGVIDLQLLEVVNRRGRSARVYGRANKRCERVGDVENIYGYSRCIDDYVGDRDLVRKKAVGRSLLNGNRFIWKSRPLSENLLDYCAVDVTGMFPLYHKLKKSDDVMTRIRVASERYADIWRSMYSRRFDKYEFNAFLPLDIIPEAGSLSFAFATTECTGCRRKFPHEEFSSGQLRNGNQKCRVCNRIRQRMLKY